jgi:hypothetical protein
MPVRSVAGLESPFGLVSDDGGFVHGRQRKSATKRAQGPGADGAARQTILRRAPEGEKAISDGSHRRAAVSRGGTGIAASVRDRLVLRDVNERIAELTGGWNETGVSLFVCECSDQRCAEPVEMTAAEYERIRADKSHFVVFPGHELPESEGVVERRARFVVVVDSELRGAPKHDDRGGRYAPTESGQGPVGERERSA